MRTLCKIALAVFAFSLFNLRACLGETSNQAGLSRDGMLVLQSDMVVRARLHVPVAEIKAAQVSKKFDYVVIQAKILKSLKDNLSGKTIDIRYYSEPKDYSPSPNTIVSLDGKEVLAFITQIDEGPVGYYFAGYTPEAVRPFDSSKAQEVGKEIEKQKRLLSEYPKSKAGQADKFDKKVHDLIQKALDPKTAEDAFTQLENLGCDIVPALIRQIDDGRPFPNNSIRLDNKGPDAFEAYRFYRPKVLTEALAALLNQITGVSFGSVYNGASERELRNEVNAWRVYSMCVDIVTDCKKTNTYNR